jgi:hypothetical protein
MALLFSTRQSAQANGGAIYTTLTRRLREAGAAGITTLRGEWGFSSDERPFGDRFGTLAGHVPTYTVFVDRIPSEPLTAEDTWARTLIAEIEEFAATHTRPQPLVRVTLADSEQFFLASLEPLPGDGFVTLYPHPEQAADLVAGTEGGVMVPRSVVVPLSGISKVELLTHVPRGTRPTSASFCRGTTLT